MEVAIRYLRVAARIGAFPHEMGRRQMLNIAVRLTLTRLPDDELDSTVDYGVILHYAETLADEHFVLIETFAHRLATCCLQHEIVAGALVCVEKPGALPNGIAFTQAYLERPLLCEAH